MSYPLEHYPQSWGEVGWRGGGRVCRIIPIKKSQYRSVPVTEGSLMNSVWTEPRDTYFVGLVGRACSGHECPGGDLPARAPAGCRDGASQTPFPRGQPSAAVGTGAEGQGLRLLGLPLTQILYQDAVGHLRRRQVFKLF